ncbi:MAG: hypothetical protein QW304_02310 [Thermoproteota archaeon]
MRRDRLCLLIILCFLSTISIIGVLAAGEKIWVYSYKRYPTTGSLYGTAFVEAYAGAYKVNTTIVGGIYGWRFLTGGSFGGGHNPPSYPYYAWGSKFEKYTPYGATWWYARYTLNIADATQGFQIIGQMIAQANIYTWMG